MVQLKIGKKAGNTLNTAIEHFHTSVGLAIGTQFLSISKSIAIDYVLSLAEFATVGEIIIEGKTTELSFISPPVFILAHCSDPILLSS